MERLDNYELTDLGYGGFALVKLAKEIDTGQLYAVKILRDNLEAVSVGVQSCYLSDSLNTFHGGSILTKC